MRTTDFAQFIAAAALIVLAGLAVLRSVETPGGGGPLPDMLLAVLELEGGEPLSLLVDLPRPGAPVREQVLPGLLGAGPGWARSLEPAGDGWQMVEHGEGTSSALQERARLLSFQPGGLVFEQDSRFLFQAPDGRLRPALEQERLPGGRMRVPGPGQGFRIELKEGRLTLHQPMEAPGQGGLLLSGVDRLLGSWWMRGRDLPAWELALFQERFQAASRVPFIGAPAVADGDLDEWRTVRALVVDGRPWIRDGAAHWTGPRDSSFGVVGAKTASGIVLAVRLRDDELVEGADLLVVEGPGGTFRVPLQEAPGQVSGPGWTAAFAGRDHHSLALELHLEAQAWPLVVSLVDQDAGGTTTLATAGSLQALELLGPLTP